MWFALLLLLLAVPQAGRVSVGAEGRSPGGGQEIAWVNSTLAASHIAIKLRNSRAPGTRATSAKGASVAKGPVPSGFDSLDALGLGTSVVLPTENLQFIAEIRAFPPDFVIAASCLEMPRARGPPVSLIRAI